jgi:hypothetical protein
MVRLTYFKYEKVDNSEFKSRLFNNVSDNNPVTLKGHNDIEHYLYSQITIIMKSY